MPRRSAPISPGPRAPRRVRVTSSRGVLIAALLSVAGLACSAQAQVVAPVWTDDSPAARDALARAGELAAENNAGEAVRVLQGVLDADAERVLKSDNDPAVFVPVRSRVHALLRGSPALLERYRTEFGPRARAILEGSTGEDSAPAPGESAELAVERAYLLTPAGAEAALRQARRRLSEGAFDAARLALEPLAEHPDLEAVRPRARELALEIARSLDRADVRAWAKGWELTDIGAGYRVPAPALVRGRGAGESREIVPTERAPAAPLRVLELVTPGVEQDAGGVLGISGIEAWVMPALRDESGRADVIYWSDGGEVRALDALTLSTLWRVRAGEALEGVSGSSSALETGLAEPLSVRRVDDGAWITLAPGGPDGGGVLLTLVTDPGNRGNDGRLLALRAAIEPLGDSEAAEARARVLWSRSAAEIDPRLDGGIVRGAAVVEGSTAVVTIRRESRTRRVMSVYQAGVDLSTGRTRWVTLLATFGSPPVYRAPRPSESATLDRGIVYRADEMGLVSAVEARSGRIVFVRRLGPEQPAEDPARSFLYRPVASVRLESQPWATPAPIVVHREGAPSRVLVIEPTGGSLEKDAGGDLVALDAKLGTIAGRREGRDFGDPRYLVRVPGGSGEGGGEGGGDLLAVVTTDRVGVVPIDRFDSAEVKLGPPLYEEIQAGSVISRMAGRVAVWGAGENARLIAPVRALSNADRNIQTNASSSAGGGAGGANTGAELIVMRARDPGSAEVRPIDRAGNVLVAGEGASSHLVVAFAGGLAAHVPWNDARARLEARLAQAPAGQEAGPAVQLAELAARARDTARTLSAVDRALESLSADPLRAAGEQAARSEALQRRVFELLRSIALGAPGADGARATQAVWPIDEVVARLERAAQVPAERAEALLVRAATLPTGAGVGAGAGANGKGTGAVEALQALLADETLASVPLSELVTPAVAPAPRVPGFVASGTARDEAVLRLAELVRRAGAPAYAAFDAEARRAFGTLSANDTQGLISLARRYPLSAAAPRALVRASAQLADPRAARITLGEALALAETIVSAGAGESSLIVESAGALIERLASDFDRAGSGPALRLAQRLEARLGPLAWSAWARSALDRARAVTPAPAPTLGLAPTGRVEFLERVAPVEPLITEPGAGDLVAMQTLPVAGLNERGGGGGGGGAGEESRIVIFGVRAGDGALEPLWSRGHERANTSQASLGTPTVLRLGRETTDLFWPGARGGWVERVRTATGQTVWRSGEFAELFDPPREGESPAPSGMIYLPTPQDGQVRATDLVFAVDDKRVALVERSGRAAVLDAANGSALWRGSTPVRVVYDAALVKGRLVVAGASSTSEAAEGPIVASVDAQTGQSPARVGAAQLAPEGATAPRRLEWMRPVSGGVGMVVVACESSVSAVDAESGRVLWTTPMPDDAPAEGWIAGERVVVMMRGRSVRELALADGAVTAADVPMRARLRDAAVIMGHALPGGDLAIVTPSGLSIVAPRGVLKGQDALSAEQTLLAAGWARETKVGPVVALLSTPEPGADFTRLSIVSARDGRLVASHRVRLAADPSMIVAVEGRLIIHAGSGCAVIPME
ncbi:MAG: PQQ-binding-like beta-propeller repeat protein [Planctomycetota bacterium]|nr:PQQ-binding-like beta-propeller repeat protein [Planctomycetota bacterium]